MFQIQQKNTDSVARTTTSTRNILGALAVRLFQERSWLDHVAVLERSGFPWPQQEAFDFFDSFGLQRVTRLGGSDPWVPEVFPAVYLTCQRRKKVSSLDQMFCDLGNWCLWGLVSKLTLTLCKPW